MNRKALIRIVDDELNMRNSLKFLLEQSGFVCRCYESAKDFLVNDDFNIPGCIIMDYQMDEMSGLELQTKLNQRGIKLPVVFFSGQGDIDIAVTAMRKGAQNFIQKASGADSILSAVRQVVSSVPESYLDFAPSLTPAEAINLYSKLSYQEVKVCECINKGMLNSDIARKLQISPKTLRNYKLQIRQKLQLDDPAQLPHVIRFVIDNMKEGK